MKSIAPICALSAGILLFGWAATGWAGDRKTLTVRAGVSATQVNNHPFAYTTPGSSTTNCASNGTGYGTVNSTSPNSATINATANSTTNCSGSYTPPSTVAGNSVTVNNYDWVTDINSGDLYLLECTANWRGSKCSSLILGDVFSAEIRGNDMFITGRHGLKPVTIKYKVLQFRPGAGMVKASAPVTATAPTVTSKYLEPDSAHPGWGPMQSYAWNVYKDLSQGDKDYVLQFCAANPRGTAGMPKEKPAHAIDCAGLLKAKEELGQ
jgi:hypothetical protein